MAMLRPYFYGLQSCHSYNSVTKLYCFGAVGLLTRGIIVTDKHHQSRSMESASHPTRLPKAPCGRSLTHAVLHSELSWAAVGALRHHQKARGPHAPYQP